jgi:hypothetical protein
MNTKLTVAFLAFTVLLTSGCLEMEETLVLFHDGSGYIEHKTTFTLRTQEEIDSVPDDEVALTEAYLQHLKESTHGLIIDASLTSVTRPSRDKLVTAARAYFKDINKVIVSSRTPRLEQPVGSADVLKFSIEYDQDESIADPSTMSNEQKEDVGKQLSTLKVTQRIILPGMVQRDKFDETSLVKVESGGRSLVISFDGASSGGSYDKAHEMITEQLTKPGVTVFMNTPITPDADREAYNSLYEEVRARMKELKE